MGKDGLGYGGEGAGGVQVVQFMLGAALAFLPARAVGSLGTPEDSQDVSSASASLMSPLTHVEGAAQAPHLAEILGLVPSNDADTERFMSLVQGDSRGVTLVRVDGPVSFRRLAAADLLRMPQGLERVNPGPVVAIVERDGGLAYVLEPTRLLRIIDDWGPS